MPRRTGDKLCRAGLGVSKRQCQDLWRKILEGLGHRFGFSFAGMYVAAFDEVADLDLLNCFGRSIGHLDGRTRHEAVADPARYAQLLASCGEAAPDGAGGAEVGVEGVEAELAEGGGGALDLTVADAEGRVELVRDVVDGLAERQIFTPSGCNAP